MYLAIYLLPPAQFKLPAHSNKTPYKVGPFMR